MAGKYEIREKIETGFLSVLKNTPFSKAKVTEILKESGVSHQTFYRHFIDKYDLAQKIAYEKFSAFYLIYGNNATWKEIVISILNAIKNNPVFFKRLLADPEGSEIVLKGIIHTSEAFTGGKASEPGIAAWIRILMKWSASDFKTPVDEIYNQIRRSTAICETLSEEEINKVMAVFENHRLEFFIEKARKKLSKLS